MLDKLKELKQEATTNGTAQVEWPIGLVRVEHVESTWFDCKFWLNGDRVSEETLRLKVFSMSPEPLPAWVAARLEIGTAGNDRTVSEFHEDFKKWAKLVGVEQWLLPSINKFSTALRANGVVIRRETGGSYPKNISLMPDPTMEEREAMRAAYRGQQ